MEAARSSQGIEKLEEIKFAIIERNGKLDRFDASADENANGKIDDIEAYVDQNGDGIINSDDLVYNDAQPEPIQTLGFTTTWRYKKWSGGMTWRVSMAASAAAQAIGLPP